MICVNSSNWRKKNSLIEKKNLSIFKLLEENSFNSLIEIIMMPEKSSMLNNLIKLWYVIII